ncbi:MAG: AAA family ATPase, partial [bacterium]
FNILLQILEDGRLTDAQGREVDFRNTVIIMTSNVGAQHLKGEATVGFRPATAEETYKGIKDRVLADLKRTFRPEFLNRIDEIIVFHQLEEEHLQEIVDLMLKDVKKRLAEKGIGLEVSGEAKKLLTREGYDPTLGARPLRRAIQRLVENPLAEELLAGRIKAGDVVQVDVKEGNLTFTPRERVAQETS